LLLLLLLWTQMNLIKTVTFKRPHFDSHAEHAHFAWS
jgi:hypothetical protein